MAEWKPSWLARGSRNQATRRPEPSDRQQLRRQLQTRQWCRVARSSSLQTGSRQTDQVLGRQGRVAAAAAAAEEGGREGGGRVTDSAMISLCNSYRAGRLIITPISASRRSVNSRGEVLNSGDGGGAGRRRRQRRRAAVTSKVRRLYYQPY